MKNKIKEQLINQLTLIDTSAFRCIRKCRNGTYEHEPPGFRNNLKKIYNKLNEVELIMLINLKKNE